MIEVVHWWYGMVLGDGGWETTEPVRTQPEAPPRHRCDQWHMTQLCFESGYILVLALMLHDGTRNQCVCVDQCDQWHMTLGSWETSSLGQQMTRPRAALRPFHPSSEISITFGQDLLSKQVKTI